MLAANASPNLNKTGMLLLLNIGMLIKMAPTLKNIKKNICNCINEIEIDIITGHRQRALDYRIRFASANINHHVSEHIRGKREHGLHHPRQKE